ncbi:MAG TPA: multiheme c-type cytochrome [Thermodesulfovibrionales bacterium]|nr:multiheme c-type cytochrome [Thermodesulfovibrionales bacterium]
MRYILAFLLLLGLPCITAATEYREEFEKEFLSKPWAGEQSEKSVCIECHASEAMKPAFQKIPEEWRKSWHYENSVSCHDCHGGDPKDAALAMSPQRGFVGAPKYNQVPEFCGKCHAGILKNYLESGHGKALKASGSGPNCVTCHGSHNIQRASIDIINEQRCTQCHTYERAKVMKQALFLTEKKINDIEKDLRRLRAEGVFTEEADKTLFSTSAEFRTLFHSVDVSLIKKRTDEFSSKLQQIQVKMEKTFRELGFRRNFSAFLLLTFAGMAIVLFLLSKTPKG